MQYTDIHSHVIWGVDDGAENRRQTAQMLRAAAADGITRIICTPHWTPGIEEFPEERFLRHLEAARGMIAEAGLEMTLTRGAEILYTDFTPRLLREGKVPTLQGSRHPLIEFSPTDTWDHILDALQKVFRAGFSPVIAHIERYPAIHSADQVRKLRGSCGALVQVNARTLLRKQPLMRRKYFDTLFEEGLVDFIATDTHALPGRETCLRQGLEALRDSYGAECADRILRKTHEIFG